MNTQELLQLICWLLPTFELEDKFLRSRLTPSDMQEILVAVRGY